MVRERFQVANRLWFKDSITVHTIDQVPESKFNYAFVFKYFRYWTSNNKSNYINVVEIEFYDKNNKLIEGEIIGNDGSFESIRNDKFKVFDENVLTYFNSAEPRNAWVGLATSTKQHLCKIIYLPRNDDNFIKEGEIYELFYWNNTPREDDLTFSEARIVVTINLS